MATKQEKKNDRDANVLRSLPLLDSLSLPSYQDMLKLVTKTAAGVGTLFTILNINRNECYNLWHSSEANKPAKYDKSLKRLPRDQYLLFCTAHEIVASEHNFVKILDLITIEMPKAIRKSLAKDKKQTNKRRDSMIAKLMPKIEDLACYKLLNSHMAEMADKRLLNWRRNPKVADILVQYGHRNRHYLSYIREFEHLLDCLEEACEDPAFTQALKDFETMEMCNNFPLRAHLLKPIQRLPQYKLLLDNYLHEMKKSLMNADEEDAQKAAAIFSEIVDHIDTALKKQAQMEDAGPFHRQLMPIHMDAFSFFI